MFYRPAEFETIGLYTSLSSFGSSRRLMESTKQVCKLMLFLLLVPSEMVLKLHTVFWLLHESANEAFFFALLYNFLCPVRFLLI